MTREALDGDDLDARSGDGHNRAAGKEGTLGDKGQPNQKAQKQDHRSQKTKKGGGSHIEIRPFSRLQGALNIPAAGDKHP
ncbi:hypothetical protein GCM10027590_14810 [Nocardiopsis nanhaiensis]